MTLAPVVCQGSPPQSTSPSVESNPSSWFAALTYPNRRTRSIELHRPTSPPKLAPLPPGPRDIPATPIPPWRQHGRASLPAHSGAALCCGTTSLSCSLQEARGRIGGRIETVTLGDSKVWATSNQPATTPATPTSNPNPNQQPTSNPNQQPHQQPQPATNQQPQSATNQQPTNQRPTSNQHLWLAPLGTNLILGSGYCSPVLRFLWFTPRLTSMMSGRVGRWGWWAGGRVSRAACVSMLVCIRARAGFGMCWLH